MRQLNYNKGDHKTHFI